MTFDRTQGLRLEGGSPLPPGILENRNFATLAASQERRPAILLFREMQTVNR